MRIPLNEFELHVRPEPLERGLAIFERGQVEDLRSLGKGKVFAYVEDGDLSLEPSIVIQNEVVTNADCACEESGNGICRHVIALIFALQSGEFPEGVASRSGKMPKEKAPAKGRGRPKVGAEPEPPKAKKVAVKKPKPPKTPADILSIVSHEDLKAFVLEELKRDKNFGIRLKAHFAEMMPASTPAEVSKRISEMTQAAITVKGKRKTLNAQQFSERSKEWLSEAKRQIDLQEYLLPFTIADKLDSVIGDLKHQFVATDFSSTLVACEALVISIGEVQLPEEVRVEFIKMARESWKKHYHQLLPIILLASRICKDGPEFREINAMFNDVILTADDNEIKVHWEMVRRVGGEQASKDFAKKYRELPFFLRSSIDEAIADRNFDEALRLANRGMELHSGYYGHGKAPWMELKDKVLEAKGDLDGRVELRLKAYHENVSSGLLVLASIKEIAGTDRWVKERTILADAIAVRTHPNPTALLALFAIGEDWAGMLEFLKRYKVSRYSTLARSLAKFEPKGFGELLKSQLDEAMTNKVRLTQFDLSEIAYLISLCTSIEETLEYFKGFSAKFSSSMVVHEFMKSAEKEIRRRHAYSYSYFY
ncbi:MAG: hypothetical protein U0176_00790 [Bacteroidia bacterium]